MTGAEIPEGDRHQSVYDVVLARICDVWEDRADKMDSGWLAGDASPVVAATWRMAAGDVRRLLRIARHEEVDG